LELVILAKLKAMQTLNKYQNRLDWLIKRVCIFKEIEPSQLYVKTRKREIVDSRAIIVINLHGNSDLPIKDIMAVFGLKRSNFFNLKKLYRNLYKTDHKFRVFVTELEIDYNNSFTKIISFRNFINNQVISSRHADNYSVARALVCH